MKNKELIRTPSNNAVLVEYIEGDESVEVIAIWERKPNGYEVGWLWEICCDAADPKFIKSVTNRMAVKEIAPEKPVENRLSR